MKLTNKIFNDLAIYMVGLGVVIGLVFPFFSLFLGVPREIAFTFTYFISCIVAGMILGVFNILLARRTVGVRIRQLSLKMKHVEGILINKKKKISDENCTPETCLIKIESNDEFGESADSFNNLVSTLSEVLETHSEIQLFTEMLTAHLDLNLLARETLSHLIRNTNANGGAILIEKGGELIVEASDFIRDYLTLENNNQILKTARTLERQLIESPDEILMQGILLDFSPKELLMEPIIHNNVFLGALILVNEMNFSENALDKITFFNKSLSLAFRNAITHSQMQHLAAVDALTGLYNRRFGMLRLEEEWSRASRSSSPVSLLMFDIDRFKKVNDDYGHLVGDKVLINTARIASSAIREEDVLLRYGGEEFICILPGTTQKDAFAIGERMRRMVMESSVENNGQDVKITVSIGVVTYPQVGISTIEQFTQRVDEAMYRAKDAGRNRTVCY